MSNNDGFLMAGTVRLGMDGSTDTFRDVGETDDCEVQIQSELVVLPSKREGMVGQAVNSVSKPKETTLSLTLRSTNRENLAIFLLGEESDINVLEGTHTGRFPMLHGGDLLLPHKHLSEIISVGDSARASLTTGTVSENNGMLWKAVHDGITGNLFNISLNDPGVTDQSATITIAGAEERDIIINLATDSSAEVITTANNLISTFSGHPTLSGKLTVSNVQGSDGTGLMAAIPKSNLSGGISNFVEGVDYTVNRRDGFVHVLGSGSILDASEQLISYQFTGSKGFKIQGAVKSSFVAPVLLTGVNQANNKEIQFLAYKAVLIPDGALNFLSGDFASLKIKGTLEIPSGKTSPFEYQEV